MKNHERHFTRARDIIRASGARLTQPRTAVLAALLSSGRALSHQDVFEALPASFAIDRVTIYRVLEWLVEARLAHRISGDDRVWRFTVSQPGDELHEHAHFACEQCGRVECLPKINTALTTQLPKGYISREVEMTIKGLCAACAVPH